MGNKYTTIVPSLNRQCDVADGCSAMMHYVSMIHIAHLRVWYYLPSLTACDLIACQFGTGRIVSADDLTPGNPHSHPKCAVSRIYLAIYFLPTFNSIEFSVVERTKGGGKGSEGGRGVYTSRDIMRDRVIFMRRHLCYMMCLYWSCMLLYCQLNIAILSLIVMILHRLRTGLQRHCRW